jgi:hypothetical protein
MSFASYLLNQIRDKHEHSRFSFFDSYANSRYKKEKKCGIAGVKVVD